jgi:hypothetical protein
VSTPRSRYLLALGVCLGTVLFLLLGIGALGIVGDGDRDWLYLAAPAVLLVVAAVMYAVLFAVGAWLFSRVRVSDA